MLTSYPILMQLPWAEAIARDSERHAWRSVIHGPDHWERVAQNGLRIGLVSGADLRVVLAFSLIHDAFRQNDGHDPYHSDRAVSWMSDHTDELGLTDTALVSLEIALSDHDKGRVYPAATVGTCWDADRLDLPRVGVQPSMALMSTEAGKEEARAWVSPAV